MTDGTCDTYYRYGSYGGYSKLDQLIAVERKYGSMTTYRSASYQYDPNYNRTRLRDGEGGVTQYQYDADNRLTLVGYPVFPGGYATEFQYEEVGNRATMTEANGDVASYVYDNVYRLVSEEKRDSGQNLLYIEV
ncbi:MAG TPA: RHS repeat domain-containing protein [Armatimonadota bacterium]|nr:RHS repeat domain-containing protein [Armatimonadota bacterium]